MATEKQDITQSNLPEKTKDLNGADSSLSFKANKRANKKAKKPVDNSNLVNSDESKTDVTKISALLKNTVKKQDTKNKSGAVIKTEPSQSLAVQIKDNKNDTAEKTSVLKRIFSKVTVQVSFMLRFHTKPGQNLFIKANNEIFGNDDVSSALPMQYFNEEYWIANVKINTQVLPEKGLIYNYVLKNEDGLVVYDAGRDKKLERTFLKNDFTLIIDSWNHAGYVENVFFTEPFKKVLLKGNYLNAEKAPKNYTHIFRIKAPSLIKNETICIVGNVQELGSWNEAAVKMLLKKEGEDFFYLPINLSKGTFPLIYKYGVYNLEQKKFVRYEDGNNRFLFDTFAKNKTTIVNDGFALLQTRRWKGAGVAIPVFSLTSKNSCGVGEFTDLKLLVDWAKRTGLQLIQILPVNDTSAKKTWADSYPYAAISAFALHPMYLNLEAIAEEGNKHLLDEIDEEKKLLNNLDAVDYEKVNNLKWRVINALYPLQKEKTFASDKYKRFFESNKTWLVPYAVFCFLRDEFGTADFNQWPNYNVYNEVETEALLNKSVNSYNKIAIHFFVQFHLHLQLKEASHYANANGIILKGDIPIGVYRCGADAWQNPELYNMNMQAGSPPDQFAVKGQNWGFPTYNWQKMKEDNFAWWKQRFSQMSNYFDAFRIDHILGFFRIWSIPINQVEGIMGFFNPVIPVHINEFYERKIWFDYNRYCKPFINDSILTNYFGDEALYIKVTFLLPYGDGNYDLRPEYATQKQVQDYFKNLEENDYNKWLCKGLFDLISNILFFEVEGSDKTQFHFRFGIENTLSFQHLKYNTQNQLRNLYVNYFFERQDGFWMKEAMQKLPLLKRATNMLVCGEDLGLVPRSVPQVMQQLSILSLEIQRMPKESNREFFNPNEAPYLSVVTPSTHDMSTIRGWWEEDRSITQHFYNNVMGELGSASYFCEDWINRVIVLQHLYSPAMWSIFQLQDLLGINADLRKENPHDERINVPADVNNYWNYRMHISLEELLEKNDYNNQLLSMITASGRAMQD